jgi:DNA invertase Pin-like site-specific DNA recombinase
VDESSLVAQIDEAQRALSVARETAARLAIAQAKGLSAETALPLNERELIALNMRHALTLAGDSKKRVALLLNVSLKTIYNRLASSAWQRMLGLADKET